MITPRSPAPGVRGVITTELQIPGGERFGRDVRENLITNAGLIQIMKMIAGIESTPFTHLQIGTGARVRPGDQIPNPQFDPEYPDSPTNREYLPVGSARTFLPDQQSLFDSYMEQAAVVQAIGRKVQFAATFRIPVDVAVCEAGAFSGPRTASPIALNMATFIDTVQRIRMAGAVPETPEILFHVTWTVGFAWNPFGQGYFEEESRG